MKYNKWGFRPDLCTYRLITTVHREMVDSSVWHISGSHDIAATNLSDESVSTLLSITELLQ